VSIVFASVILLTGCGKGGDEKSPAAGSATSTTETKSAPPAAAGSGVDRGAATGTAAPNPILGGQAPNPAAVNQALADAAKALAANPDQAAKLREGFEAAKAFSAAAGSGVEPVDFRKLTPLLPESLPGLARSGAPSGEKSGVLGMKMSHAEVSFESEDGKSITVGIQDAGGMSGALGQGLAAWASVDVDRETADGYEKTTTYQGFKAFERYNTADRDGEIQVWISDRFLVNVSGNSVSADEIKAALGKVDLKKLAALK
jgi:hypothetical protein